MGGADETIGALSALKERIRAATRDVVGTAAEMFQTAVRINAPIGTPGNSTNPPGDLAASVEIDGPEAISADIFHAQVGPTTIYARQRELGGDIYGNPLHFWRFEQEIFTYMVHQEGEFYTLRGYLEVKPLINPMARAKIADAVAGI